MNVTALSADEIVSNVRALNAEGNRVLAKLLVFLGEMDKRELYKDFACSSMFAYCRKLGMSEGSTARRIDSARAIRKFPTLLPLIESGKLHITALSIVSGILTPENVESVIASVMGKTTREIEEVKVRFAPRPDVKDLIRKLPSVAVQPSAVPVPPSMAVIASAATETEPTRPSLPRFAPPSMAVTGTESAPPAVPVFAPPPVAVTAPVVRLAPPMKPVVPIKEDGYKVQFQTDKAMVDQIDRIKAMMRHRNPKGDLGTMFSEALDLLEAKLEKEIFAVTSRPQKVRKPCAPGQVAAATRREVFERDGRQCTFVSADGDRCAERGLLELDHIDPAALDGSDDASNLRVRCRAHNQMHAKEVFGADYIERRIEESRRDRAKRAAGHSTAGGESDRSP